MASEALAKPLPASLQANRRLDQWLRFSRGGYVEIFSGKVELGQGILTALAQIVAEELDVRLDQVRMIAANTAVSPNEGITAGSLSIQESGTALRQACAEAREIFLRAAGAQLNVSVDDLNVSAGDISCEDGRRTSYWALADESLLDREATAQAVPKPAAGYTLVGRAAARSDLPDKIFGQPRFIHDLELPGMLHGRILRPPSPSSTLLSLDDGEILISGSVVTIVRDGSLLGILADSERGAELALIELAKRALWRQEEDLPDEQSLAAWLKAQEADTTVVASKVADTATAVARTMKASYSKPFLVHGSIAPSCALARFDGKRLEVWTHSQGIFNLRRDLSLSFGIEDKEIVVQHVEGGGCYGHNAADDVAFDAAWLARAAEGRAVRVQWTRADELSCGPMGPAMAVDLEADLDAAGAVIAWRHTVWSNGHSTRPGRSATPALLGSWRLAQPFARPMAINAPLAAGGGSERNTVPLYEFPQWHVVNHRVLAMPLRTSALRSLGAFANIFASESFIDELAFATANDPVDFRLRYLQDPRARAVIERAAAKAQWLDWQPREGLGHGIGFARYKNKGAYCAVVAEVEAEAEIRIKRLILAVDVGMVINPDGVANQMEGGAIQAASWTLKEAVRFDRNRVSSDSWEDYPIFRFTDIPSVAVEIIESEHPSLGAGEAQMGPTAAAIANAVFNALGVRVRDLPITAERILAALE